MFDGRIIVEKSVSGAFLWGRVSCPNHTTPSAPGKGTRWAPTIVINGVINKLLALEMALQMRNWGYNPTSRGYNSIYN